MRYRAFISYTRADEAWARWLMRRLETWRVPKRLVGTESTYGPIGPRLGAFFRDRDELTAAGDLGASIRAALAEADALVVICSPAAARSRWVAAEVEAFRASGRGDRVLCFVVAGEPGGGAPDCACFPRALLTPDADGRTIEPLAADARREGDGRERAFLKLVAGLLGIGYDALARREMQRRTRRLTVIAVASLAGMAIALVLAAAAYVARNDAQRRQAQAEDLLGFMLGDLREKLTTVGRLDLMRTMDDKASAYFATLDPRDLSDRALEQQARSLTGIGQVRLEEGNHDGAMAAFREAHARSTALHQRAPENGQRLFDLAQAEYWIGNVAYQQGRDADAAVWFGRYRDSALRLAAMDPDSLAWQQEVVYGHTNLAILDERRGRYAEGERAMRQVLALNRQWSQAQPGDTELRASVADTVSWLGSLTAQQGKLAQAEDFFAEQVSALSRNAAAEPGNVRWQERKADALILLARVQSQRGRLAEAADSIAAALPLAVTLARQDPSNYVWQVTPGICHWWQAQLAAAAHDPAAQARAAEAAAVFARAVRAEPKNERPTRWLAKARHLQAQLALARGDAAAAKVRLASAASLVAPAPDQEPDESLRQLQAEHLLLTGEAAQLLGDAQAARQRWQQAEQRLLANPGTALPFDRLDLLVRSQHHLGRIAQAHAHQQRLDAAGYVPLRPWPASPARISQVNQTGQANGLVNSRLVDRPIEPDRLNQTD